MPARVQGVGSIAAMVASVVVATVVSTCSNILSDGSVSGAQLPCVEGAESIFYSTMTKRAIFGLVEAVVGSRSALGRPPSILFLGGCNKDTT